MSVNSYIVTFFKQKKQNICTIRKIVVTLHPNSRIVKSLSADYGRICLANTYDFDILSLVIFGFQFELRNFV